MPAISARLRPIRSDAPAKPPSAASAPAWASISPTATRVPGPRPRCAAAAGVRDPRSAPTGAGRPAAPIRARSVSPNRASVASGQPAPALQPHLQIAGQIDRTSRPVAAQARKSQRSKMRPARAQASGLLRLSHRSFGSAISGEVASPGPAPVSASSASASSMARWSSQSSVSQSSPAPGVIPTGAPAASRTTSEQVASKARAATASGGAPASARAARRATPTACQIWALDCSARRGPSRRIASGASARPSSRPPASKRPARALPVPTSTAARIPGRLTAGRRGRACGR